jgi:hypothetical protein
MFLLLHAVRRGSFDDDKTELLVLMLAICETHLRFDCRHLPGFRLEEVWHNVVLIK